MKKDLLAILLICLVIALFCQEIFTQQASPFRGDIPLQFYPWKAYTRTMLAQGELPYWNPYTFGGAPFLANMQSAVFYPLDLLLFLFPMEWFFGLSLVLHLWLAAVGCYLLARICGASSVCAILAGVAYGLNGFTMIHIPAGNHLTYAGAAWVPWMYWVAAGFILSKAARLRWLLCGSLIVFLHFLCGHPQMTFYSLFFSVLFCLALSFWQAKYIEKRYWKIPFFKTFIFGLFLMLGIVMAGMQLYPTLEYLQQANRASSLDLQMATEFSFAPHRLITLFLPEYYGTKGFIPGDNHYDFYYYWSNAYTGLIVPLLAVFAFRGKPRPASVIPLGLVGLLGIFFAWGRGNPIYALLFQLPGFGHFRAPAKFLPYYLVSVCVLAAIGVERLAAEAFDRYKKSPTSQKQAVWNIGLVFLLFLIFLLGYSSIQTLYEAIRRQTGGDAVGNIRNYSFMIGVVLFLSAVTLYSFAGKSSKPRFAMALSFSLLLCMDLFTFGRGYLLLSLAEPARIDRLSAAPPEIRTLRSQEGFAPSDRVATLADLYFPNYTLLWEVKNIAGYDPMSLELYNRLIREMENWEPGVFQDNILLKQFDHPSLDLLNVRYVLTGPTQELSKENVQRRVAGSFLSVYERKSPDRSWVYASPDTNSLPQDVQIWNNVREEVDVTQYRPHQIRFSYQTNSPVWLRVAEWYYPGWRAQAVLAEGDPRDVEIKPSAEGFRTLRLPEGLKEVVLYYQGPVYGWVLTLFGISLFAGFVLLEYLYRTERLYHIVQRLMGRYY